MPLPYTPNLLCICKISPTYGARVPAHLWAFNASRTRIRYGKIVPTLVLDHKGHNPVQRLSNALQLGHGSLQESLKRALWHVGEMFQFADWASFELRDLLNSRHHCFHVFSPFPALPLTSAVQVSALCIVELLPICLCDALNDPSRASKDAGGIFDRAILGSVLLAPSLQYDPSDFETQGRLQLFSCGSVVFSWRRATPQLHFWRFRRNPEKFAPGVLRSSPYKCCQILNILLFLLIFWELTPNSYNYLVSNFQLKI